MRYTTKVLNPAAVAAALALAQACGGGGPAPELATTAPVRVATAQVELSRVPLTVEATGAVEPRVSVSPGTKIMGRVERVPVDLGDRVEKGQVLAELEQRDLAAAVEQARAAVAVAEANLDNARAQFRRMSELRARGSVTEKGLEDATSAFRVAEAQLAQAQAARAAAEVTLSYARIESPVSGHVTAKHVEAGDMAAPGMPMFTVEDASTVIVAIRLPESEVVGLETGHPARVRVDAIDGTFEGTVDRVVPAGDPASRTFRVEARLPNPAGALKSGMFARATLERGERDAVLVPRSAVVERGQLRGVYVLDEGVARLRWIRLGRERGDAIEILSGLVPGERYVPAPPAGFADGTPVEAR